MSRGNPRSGRGFTLLEFLIVMLFIGIISHCSYHAYVQATQGVLLETSSAAIAEVEPPLHIEPLSNGALYVWGEGTVLVRCGDPSDCIPELNTFFDKYRDCDIVGGIPYSGAPQGWLVEKGFIFFVRNPLGCPKVPECP